MLELPQLQEKLTNMYIKAYQGDFQPIRDMCSRAFICRNPNSPLSGIEDVMASIAAQREAFEDIKLTVQYSFASDAGFGIVYVLSGRHVKEIFGYPPSGKYVQIPGISIHELVDGKSIGAYSCGSFDVLGRIHAASKP